MARWGSWVFTKRMGTETSGLSELATIQGQEPTVAERPTPPAYPIAPQTHSPKLILGLIALSVVVLVMVLWKLLA